MSRFTKISMAICSIGIVLLGVSAFTVFKTSFKSHEEVVDTHCLNFLGDCKYISEKRKVTDFNPFNTTNLVMIPFLILVFIVSVVLLSLGEGNLNSAGRTVYISLGLLLFASVFVGLFLYGNSKKGQYEVTGGITPEQNICKHVASNFDLDRAIINGFTPQENKCLEGSSSE